MQNIQINNTPVTLPNRVGGQRLLRCASDTLSVAGLRIASVAMEAMLYEVSATPKPGLVDRNNCGAHHDMDFFTFMSSAAGLHAAFDAMVIRGIALAHNDIAEILPAIRPIGAKAEQDMFAFTKGVNTHKGMIFSLGILCACAGWALGNGYTLLKSEDLCLLAARMCVGICDVEYKNLDKKDTLTKGERMYLQYGFRGVRGEVEDGYPLVVNFALPFYRKLRAEQINLNDALVQTLLYLIAKTNDTNIASRHDMETAVYAQRAAQKVLDLGGVCTEEGRCALEQLDKDFIERYISPGGCADLLAVTHFLYTVELSVWVNKGF